MGPSPHPGLGCLQRRDGLDSFDHMVHSQGDCNLVYHHLVPVDIPRLRIDQLLALEWKYLLPINLVNLVLMVLVVCFGLHF